MNTPQDMICDHVNHDGLDNRRKNCRNCTIEQNNANRRKRGTCHGPPATNSPSSPHYIGVTYCRRRRKWVSYIKHHGRSKNLGLYKVEEDATLAHNKAAWAQWGEYANLNFPEEYPGHPAATPSSAGQIRNLKHDNSAAGGRQLPGGVPEIRSKSQAQMTEMGSHEGTKARRKARF